MKNAMDIIVVALLDLEYVWNEVRKLREERVQLIFVFELICNDIIRKVTCHPSSIIDCSSIYHITQFQNFIT